MHNAFTPVWDLMSTDPGARTFKSPTATHMKILTGVIPWQSFS